MTHSTQFKNPVGIRYTKELFFEMTLADKTNVLYTLKEDDHMGYPSIFRLYLEEEDPTEYTFATKYFEGVDHWEKLCTSNWFTPYLVKMRHALELKLKSHAFASIKRDALDPESKSSSSSAKFILERGYEAVNPDKRKAGRPSKREIAEAARLENSFKEEIKDDFERIRLVTQ